MKKFLEILLYGISQVFLQKNLYAGILILIGIFYNSIFMGFGAIFGSLIGTLFAYVFKYEKKDIEDGLYGFNSTLVSLGILYFFGFSIISVISIVTFGILSTILMKITKNRIKTFTFPFIISTWLLLILIYFIPFINYLNISLLEINVNLNYLESLTTSFGQVMFQENIVTGIFFILAMLVSSRFVFIYSVFGVLISIFLSYLFLLPITLTNIGIFGYNSVLTSIALGDNKKIYHSLGFIFMGTILSIFILLGFQYFDLVALTMPFVLATWIVLFIKSNFK